MQQQDDTNKLMRVSFRGKELSARQLTRIKQIVAAGQGQSRQQLARQVCRALGWHRPNGALAVRPAVRGRSVINELTLSVALMAQAEAVDSGC